MADHQDIEQSGSVRGHRSRKARTQIIYNYDDSDSGNDSTRTHHAGLTSPSPHSSRHAEVLRLRKIGSFERKSPPEDGQDLLHYSPFPSPPSSASSTTTLLDGEEGDNRKPRKKADRGSNYRSRRRHRAHHSTADDDSATVEVQRLTREETYDRDISLSMTEEELLAEWGVLFTEDGKPTDRFADILTGLAVYVVRSQGCSRILGSPADEDTWLQMRKFDPKQTNVISPKQMRTFYSHFGLGDSDDDCDEEPHPLYQLFRSSGKGTEDRGSHKRVRDLYDRLECEYHLVPSSPPLLVRQHKSNSGKKRSSPHHPEDERIPGLTATGFAHWITFAARAYPDEEYLRLKRIFYDLPITDPGPPICSVNPSSSASRGSKHLPRHLPRCLLPKKADKESKRIFDKAVNRAVRAMENETEEEKREIRRPPFIVPPSAPKPPSAAGSHRTTSSVPLKSALKKTKSTSTTSSRTRSLGSSSGTSPAHSISNSSRSGGSISGSYILSAGDIHQDDDYYHSSRRQPETESSTLEEERMKEKLRFAEDLLERGRHYSRPRHIGSVSSCESNVGSTSGSNSRSTSRPPSYHAKYRDQALQQAQLLLDSRVEEILEKRLGTKLDELERKVDQHQREVKAKQEREDEAMSSSSSSSFDDRLVEKQRRRDLFQKLLNRERSEIEKMLREQREETEAKLELELQKLRKKKRFRSLDIFKEDKYKQRVEEAEREYCDECHRILDAVKASAASRRMYEYNQKMQKLRRNYDQGVDDDDYEDDDTSDTYIEDDCMSPVEVRDAILDGRLPNTRENYEYALNTSSYDKMLPETTTSPVPPPQKHYPRKVLTPASTSNTTTTTSGSTATTKLSNPFWPEEYWRNELHDSLGEFNRLTGRTTGHRVYNEYFGQGQRQRFDPRIKFGHRR